MPEGIPDPKAELVSLVVHQATVGTAAPLGLAVMAAHSRLLLQVRAHQMLSN